MPNMSYCRFENTYHDLQDVYENIELSGSKELSESESKYREKIINLCCDIAVDFGYEIGRSFEDE